MIRKNGYRFSLATNAKRLRGDHAQTGTEFRRNFVPTTSHENARRSQQPPGESLSAWRTGRALEHAEHDGADKGECDIGGNNAQSADESHGNAPLVHVAARYNAETSKAFRPEKVSAAVDPRRLPHLVRRQ